MLLGPGRSPGGGVFRGISELLPGSCGVLTRDGLKLWAYWRIPARMHEDSFQITAAKVRSLVEDAIRRQLVSDVPICTLLSGGLDSSLISSVAARQLKERGETLHTFSVFYEDNDKYFRPSKFQPGSDTEYIEIMKTYLGCENHRIILGTEALVEALFEAVEARDLPGMADVDSSLLLFCREIKKQCTVALSGECADEIFGGYPWFRERALRASEGFPWAQSTRYRASLLREEYRQGLTRTFSCWRNTAVRRRRPTLPRRTARRNSNQR
jgi:asparagine synthase (glutamine-hydrolysing)